MLNKQDEGTKALTKEILKDFLKLDQFKNLYKKMLIKFIRKNLGSHFNLFISRETSGFTGLGINESFEWLTNACLKR